MNNVDCWQALARMWRWLRVCVGVRWDSDWALDWAFLQPVRCLVEAGVVIGKCHSVDGDYGCTAEPAPHQTEHDNVKHVILHGSVEWMVDRLQHHFKCCMFALPMREGRSATTSQSGRFPATIALMLVDESACSRLLPSLRPHRFLIAL